MRFWLVITLLASAILATAVTGAQPAEQDRAPTFLNPEMAHVSVESAVSNGYLSICPNVCELADGTLLIAYHRTTRVDFNGEYSTWTRVSRDAGKTWGQAREVAKHLQATGLLVFPSDEVVLNGCYVLH